MAMWTNDPERITYFATTHTRGKHRAFGIRAKDRDKHFYAIGKSGMGKSTMLENLAIQDIQNGEGLVFIDPHGSTAEKLLDFIPEDRIKDTMYLAPFDIDNPIGFNILEDVGYENRHKVVAGLMGVFKRIWVDAWSARMEYILQNTLFALLEYPGATIIDVNRMLVNKAFREEVIGYITDPVVGAFWKEEFAGYSDKYTQDATPAIQNKIGQFVSNPLIRNILGQAKSTFDFRKMMDERKIVIVNLSKGRMGEANAALLGSMFVIKVYLAALSRAEEPASIMRDLPPCYFYVDEFQNVVNEAFENILSEARKYKLCLTIANQYIEQMPEEVRNAVFGNVGTTVIFRVGPMDAQFLEPVFAPTFIPEDMVGLGRGEIYLTLMIDGVGSAPFSAHTLPPIEEPAIGFREEIIAYTRRTYGKKRSEVENSIHSANDSWQEKSKLKHKNDSAKGQDKGKGYPSARPFPPRPAPGAQVPERREVPPLPEQRRVSAAPPQQGERRPEARAAAAPVPQRSAVPALGNTGDTRDTRDRISTRVSPPPTRSPAEILREKLLKKENTAQPTPPREVQERNALKDAIQKARANTTPSSQPRPHTPQPQPVSRPHPLTETAAVHSSPAPSIDSDMIRDMLHGDD